MIFFYARLPAVIHPLTRRRDLLLRSALAHLINNSLTHWQQRSKVSHHRILHFFPLTRHQCKRHFCAMCFTEIFAKQKQKKKMK